MSLKIGIIHNQIPFMVIYTKDCLDERMLHIIDELGKLDSEGETNCWFMMVSDSMNSYLPTGDCNGVMECIMISFWDLSYLYEGPIVINEVHETQMDYQLVLKLCNHNRNK